MKLTFSTLSFEDYDLDGLIAVCKRYGYSGFEVRCGQKYDFLDHTDEQLAEAKAKLDAAGVKIIAFGSSLHVRTDSAPQMEEYLKLLRVAAALGAPGIRIFLGTYRHYVTQAYKPADYPEMISWVQRACDAGRDAGVGVFIEAHNEYGTGKILRQALDDVRRDNCKVIWDIMGPLEGHEPVEETLSYLKGDVCHLHIKDGIHDPNPASLEHIYTPMRKGTIPIIDILAGLENAGYPDLCYSLEWEPKWRPELAVFNLPEEDVLRDYAEYMHELYGSLAR